MTPETLAEIAKTAGLPAAILLYMWINRAPTPKEKRDDPATRILAKLDSIEDRILDNHADLQILKDRKPR